MAVFTTSGPAEKLLSHSEVANLLDVHRCTLHRWRSAGLVPDPVYISGLPRWFPEEIYAWLNAGAPPARKWNQVKKVFGNKNFQKMSRSFDDRNR